MPQVWDGKFANPKIPIGMSGPLYLQVVAIVEWRLDLFSHQLIDDHTIVDSLDAKLAARV